MNKTTQYTPGTLVQVQRGLIKKVGFLASYEPDNADWQPFTIAGDDRRWRFCEPLTAKRAKALGLVA